MSESHLSALEDLFARRHLGVKFSLDRMVALCRTLGEPQKRLKFIHIAGTNGKGSVAAMIAAILQEGGSRTGLYTSPHLVRYHERFRIQGLDIPDEALDRFLAQIMACVREETFFEITTMLALSWFAEEKVEWVVWETGLGGRLDATNVVTPEVAIITHIGFDHMAFLGNSLEEIAEEKAGIIKPGKPVITPEQPEVILQQLRAKAVQWGAPLKVISAAQLGEFESPLPGMHQMWNAALAVAAVREVCPGLEASTIRRGLARTRWPGRCQRIERKDRPPVLLDGAHNVLGAEALAGEILKTWGKRKVTLIFGALADKPVQGMAAILRPCAAEVFLVPVLSERSCPPADLIKNFPNARSFDSFAEGLDAADQRERPIVVTGSLFLVGEALQELLGSTGSRHPAELFTACRV